MNELITISKLQQAKLAIHEVKELDELKRIIDQTEALRNYARAQKLSQEMKDDITEYNLYATRQVGILSVELQKTHVNRYTSNVEIPNNGISKKATLADAGIDIRRANEAEKLAAIPESEFAEIIAEKRESGELTKNSVNQAVKSRRIDQRREELINKSALAAETLSGKLLEGDLFDKITEIADVSVDLLFADPPYMVLDEEWDQYNGIDDFMRFTQNWLDAVIPKVKSTGRIYISFAHDYQFELYNLFKAKGFYGFNFGQMIIWHYRNNNKPFDRNKYRYTYEPIFYLYGRNAETLNFPPETFGETQFNVWTIATPQSNFNEGKFHPAQKPLELLERIILTGSKTGDTVLDPFAGSGTTGVAAKKLNRNYILIERESEYCQIAKGRLHNADVG